MTYSMVPEPGSEAATSARRPRRVWVVLLPLTLAWLVALAVSAAWLVASAFAGWAEPAAEPSVRVDEEGRAMAMATLGVLALAVGGPTLLAVVAFACRRPWTAVVYLAVAAMLGALTLPLAINQYRAANPPPSWPDPTHCQERSGGDSRCPGG